MELKENKIVKNEKEDEFKKSNEKFLMENKKLERQKNEILNGIKKQFKLIENLKKQKMHLESLPNLNFSEADFIKAVDLPEKML